MATDPVKQFTEQFEKGALGPMRSYARLATDHAEALAGIQIEAARAFADLGFKELRAALDIRGPEPFRPTSGSSRRSPASSASA